jgi:hypothetical protein
MENLNERWLGSSIIIRLIFTHYRRISHTHRYEYMSRFSNHALITSDAAMQVHPELPCYAVPISICCGYPKRHANPTS